MANVNGEEIYKEDLNEYLNLIYLTGQITKQFSVADKEEALKEEILWFLIKTDFRPGSEKSVWRLRGEIERLPRAGMN